MEPLENVPTPRLCCQVPPKFGKLAPRHRSKKTSSLAQAKSKEHDETNKTSKTTRTCTVAQLDLVDLPIKLRRHFLHLHARLYDVLLLCFPLLLLPLAFLLTAGLLFFFFFIIIIIDILVGAIFTFAFALDSICIGIDNILHQFL